MRRYFDFIGKISVLFAAFRWIAPFRLQRYDTELKNGNSYRRSEKQVENGCSKSKQPKQVYSRRLTRNQENYAKD